MTASPIKAPHDRLNRNLTKVSKLLILQYFLAMTRTKAAKNPIAEIPTPARTPYPHICAVVK